jgi:hypothetical protein
VDAPSHNQPAAPVYAPPRAPASTGLVAAALGTWLRYLAPLTVLSAVALSPVIAVALATRLPSDGPGASATLTRGWLLVALAWPCQLVLVGAASAVTDATSQLRALGHGLVQLVRAILPCLAAIAAIAIGSLALVLPGVLLFILLAPTGASRARGITAALADTIAATRKQLLTAALVVAAMLTLDAAIGIVGYRALVGAMASRPTPIQLAAARSFVRTIALALVIASPLPTTLLAVLRRRGDPAGS